ncbi:MAG TPA: homoserine O-acetyltransferase [Egibacteraceae bacterium]|nr:homoserine O-acetyltransferase [Egibacteraceae bacterium]
MTERPPPPASGAWRPGEPPGRRRFARVFTDRALQLEAGGSLGDIEVAYETWGTPAIDGANALLVCHALTGDSHASGPPAPGHPTPGWWDGLVGPGKAIDTDRWFVVCPNVLGGCQGTTGPASDAGDGRPWGPRWPRTTIRDQVAVEAALADALGIGSWGAVVGGSMGGMRVLEWAVGHPERVESAVVVAAGAAASAEQIALQSTQVRAIRLDPGFRGGDYYGAPAGAGPHEGLGLARRIGHLTYRTEREVEERFGRLPQDGEEPLAGGRYQVESYLDHHADKLARRFDANSYIALSEAMSHHDVGRDRGGVGAALSRVRARTWVFGIDADRLYPVYLQRRIADLVPICEQFAVIPSMYGHDGFLIETGALTPLFRGALAGARCPST